jgi:group I intron endonuclease
MMKRWEGHVKSSQKGSSLIFHRAIQKHGSELFDHEVLEICETRIAGKLREIFWIAKLETFTNRNKGYNMTPGGDGVTSLSPEDREKHKLATTAGVNRPEVKERVKRELKKALANPLIKQRMKLVQREIQSRPEAKKRFDEMKHRPDVRKKKAKAQSKTVEQFSLNGELIAVFESAHQASNKTGVNRGYICACARGECKQASGFTWKYVPKNKS